MIWGDPSRFRPALTTRLLLLLTFVYLLCGCGQKAKPLNNTASNPATPSEAVSVKDPVANFTDVAQQAGLNYQWAISGKKPYNLLQTVGNGCAFLDYNSDGRLDILLVGSRLALYRNEGQSRFRDVTNETRLNMVKGHFLGCATGDYDNDGYTDIYISAFKGGVLLHNDRGLSLRDVTRIAGLQAQPWGTSCAFADVNNDGKLDLYIANYLKFGPDMHQLCDYEGVLSACPPFYYLPEKGVLYINQGGGRFRDGTKSWRADSATGKSLGVAFADFNQTGRQSLAIANDGVPGDLLLNRGQRFENAGIASGTAFDINGKTHAGMGIDWGDYDNDGRLDLVVTTFQNEPTCVYHNEDGRHFGEVSAPLGLASATLNVLTFGAKWLDYDNDGWLDLALANGHVRDNVERLDAKATYRQASQLFHNEGGRRLVDISTKAGSAWGHKIVGRGLATGDYDNDGRMDLIIADSEGRPLLLHNESKGGQWLGLRLIGSRSNRDATGAVVKIETPHARLIRRCGTDGSYLSASDPRVHFGLGTANLAQSVTIMWPSGKTSKLINVKANQYLTIRESDNH